VPLHQHKERETSHLTKLQLDAVAIIGACRLTQLFSREELGTDHAAILWKWMVLANRGEPDFRVATVRRRVSQVGIRQAIFRPSA
jgi:hypothetical protein